MPFIDDDSSLPEPSKTGEERRVALVIGNGAYTHASVLNNPANDADKMSEMLTNLGFEVVGGKKDGINIGRDLMEDLLCEFEEKAENAASSLLFYAGHGLQVGNKNYLLPVDADIKLETHLRRRAFSLNEILDIMGRKRRTSIVFLDACRDNPFARQLGRSMGTRDAASRGGLADTGRIPGSLIAFATEPDNVAYDGKNENSPFTTALLRHIEKPGQSVMDMMVHVRNDVVRETAAKQQPWTQYSLEKIFYFIPQIKGQTDNRQAQSHTEGEAEHRWDQVKDSEDIGLLEVFQNQYTGTLEAYYASQRCKLLKQQENEKGEQQEKARQETLQAEKLAEEVRLQKEGTVRVLVGLKQNSEQKLLKPGDIFQDFKNSPEMVMIPPGTFMMGSPEDEPKRSSDEILHEVTISQPFAMGRYPVTFDQWDAYVADNKFFFGGGAAKPIIQKMKGGATGQW